MPRPKMNKAKTTISVSSKTLSALQQIGKKEETYDQIIQRLISMFNKKTVLVDAQELANSQQPGWGRG